MKRKAMYFDRQGSSLVCKLCPHRCKLTEGRRGICGVRFVQGSALYTENYGEISSMGFDPIEKKPLFHYKPSSRILSIGSYGCNFSCGFCQNYSIAHHKPPTVYMEPMEVVDRASELRAEGNIGLAFTYNEPTIYYEYVLETARLCKESGLDVLVVTNGYIGHEPLRELLPYVDAMNIDLKAFSHEFYSNECGGGLESVMETIEIASKECHLEVSNLIITGYNDSIEEAQGLASYLSSVDREIPLHISRYHPAYRFTAPATSPEKLNSLYEVARSHLDYVYRGNMVDVNNDTYCPNCNNRIIQRSLLSTEILNYGNKCLSCGKHLNLVY